ncbi:hypothetical protein PR003_g13919 [Phytophthora rubi]|uniref:AAA ATPase AAA+ lid domain-containing protein n=1 Tax=Phytophthora rubi TaxID=129364 RepID=A0A6A4F0Y6_9STRA|nr:hypothetical protein PR003_g13919 [Phytophthora rubi]
MPTSSGAECKAVCTEAGMFALRERRIHVTQEDFEMAVSKVMKKDSEQNMSINMLWKCHVCKMAATAVKIKCEYVTSCDSSLSHILSHTA